MKPSQLLRPLIALLALTLASVAFAQTATVQADTAALSPAGGLVKLTASVVYEGEPGAVGWQLTVPAGWALVSVEGPQAPQIAAPAGTTGTLEFAYTRSPRAGATFSVVVRYPAGTTEGKVVPKAIIRANGKLTTLQPTPVEWQKP